MRTLPLITPILATLALAGFAATAGAQAQAPVYKSTDPAGQVHYSDRATADSVLVRGPSPQQQQQQQAAPRPPAPVAPPAARPPTAPLPVNPQQNQQVQRDVANARAEQCKQARESYDKAIRAQRVFRTNDKGEREFMSTAEADALRLQIKAEMDGACGS